MLCISNTNSQSPIAARLSMSRGRAHMEIYILATMLDRVFPFFVVRCMPIEGTGFHGVSFLSEPIVELMDGDGKRKDRKATAKRKTKKLGKIAQAAIAHNEELVEKFIEAVQEGKETRYEIGIAKGNPDDPRHPGTVSHGGGVFSVYLPQSGKYVRAAIRGLMHGRGGFFHNPEVSTAVRAGSYLVVEDLGLGHMAGGTSHQIMGVMSSGQASRARNVGIRKELMGKLNLRKRGTRKVSSNAGGAAAARKTSSGSASDDYAGEGW